MSVDSPAREPVSIGRRALVVGAAAVAVAVVVAATWIYDVHARVPFTRVAEVELGGHGGVGRTLHIMQPSGDYAEATFVADLRSTLRWGLLLLAGYGAALLIGCRLACWLLRFSVLRRRARVALAATFVVIGAAVVEDVALFQGLGGRTHVLGSDWLSLTAVLATVKYCVLVPASLGALTGLLLAVVRGLTFTDAARGITPKDAIHPLPVVPQDLASLPAGATDAMAPVGGVDPDEVGRVKDRGAGERWRRGYRVPDCVAHHENGQRIGIALSGGGIRAATLALGALQAPGMRALVARSDYLVSVSGGGYTAGAFLQLLSSGRTSELADERVIRQSATAYAPGSPEEDHLRRHASYLADSPVRLGRALMLLGRHLLLTLALLFGPAAVLGYLVGRVYVHVPVTVLSLPTGHTTRDSTVHLAFRPAGLAALGFAAGLAVLAWLAAQGAHHLPQPPAAGSGAAPRRGLLDGLARGLADITVLLGVVVIALPATTWAASSLLKASPASVAIGSPVLGVLVTYGASVASIARKRKGLLRTAGSPPKAVPGAAARLLLVVVALLMLLMLWLTLFGGLVTVGLQERIDTATEGIVGGVAVAVVLLGAFTDETTLSLHPFYRARIASAFAVRRVRLDNGHVVAEPYPPTEGTPLSSYGVTPKAQHFPHVVFAASATLGEQRTPPGANRVSYTMCSHFVGGPEVGYVSSGKLEELVSPRLRHDLTVQAAVAISGAAIAASVGGQGATWFETVLAISGARLGAWLPNPRFVIDRYVGPRTLQHPGLPRIRRAPYLLRELFGGHPVNLPLLQVTDGGFYDNLGLVELFRRGCTRIVCIDSSGDSPPAAETFAAAVRLAAAELGVDVTLDGDPWASLTPGSGAPLGPESSLSSLNSRLSLSALITGTFTYPPVSPHAERHGILVLAKASLWPALPYALLTYAQGSPTFPHDSTNDQFFDGERYDAYTALGSAMGTEAATALARLEVAAASQ